jgi:hypothetical protein
MINFSLSHLILKKLLDNPLSTQPNPKTSGFTLLGPILKWVVILLDPIRSTLCGLSFDFSQLNSAHVHP